MSLHLARRCRPCPYKSYWLTGRHLPPAHPDPVFHGPTEPCLPLARQTLSPTGSLTPSPTIPPGAISYRLTRPHLPPAHQDSVSYWLTLTMSPTTPPYPVSHQKQVKEGSQEGRRAVWPETMHFLPRLGSWQLLLQTLTPPWEKNMWSQLCTLKSAL